MIAGRRVGMCSMVPYGAGICYDVIIIFLYNFSLLVCMHVLLYIICVLIHFVDLG